MEDTEVNLSLNIKPLSTMDKLKSNGIEFLKTLQYWFTFIGLGMVAASLGWGAEGLAKHTGVDESQYGLVFILRGIGYIIGSTASGPLFDYFKDSRGFLESWNKITGNKIIVISILVSTTATALFPVVRNFILLLLLWTIFGAIQGVLVVGCNLMVTRIWRERANPFLMLLHLGYGIGAFVSPLISAQIMGKSKEIRPLQISYWIVAAIELSTISVMFFTPTPAGQIPRENSKEPLVDDQVKIEEAPRKFDIKKYLNLEFLFILYLAFITILCCGAELSFNTQIVTYVKAMFDDESAALVQSTYFMAFTSGRLINIFLAAFLGPLAIVSIDIIGALITLVIMWSFGNNLTVVYICAGAIGFFQCSIIPAFYGIPSKSFGIEMTGLMTSIMTIGCSIGEMAIPAILKSLLWDALNGPYALIYTLFAIYLSCIVLFGVVDALGIYRTIQKKKEPQFVKIEEAPKALTLSIE